MALLPRDGTSDVEDARGDEVARHRRVANRQGAGVYGVGGYTAAHPDAETALQAAKQACRAHPGRWFGRSSTGTGPATFLVYEGSKVIERHVVGK